MPWRQSAIFYRDADSIVRLLLTLIPHRTSYDSNEKKHWLSVHKGDLVGRFMLQDNLKPAWHSETRSTQEKICDAVDSMIEKIDDEEEKSSS